MNSNNNLTLEGVDFIFEGVNPRHLPGLLLQMIPYSISSETRFCRR